MDDICISRAEHADLPELLALLAAVDLPPEGVEEYLDGFMVARDAEGRAPQHGCELRRGRHAPSLSPFLERIKSREGCPGRSSRRVGQS